MPLQERNPAGVIVVDVCRYHQIELGDAIIVSQFVEVVLNKSHGLQTVIIGTDVHVREEGVPIMNKPGFT